MREEYKKKWQRIPFEKRLVLKKWSWRTWIKKVVRFFLLQARTGEEFTSWRDEIEDIEERLGKCTVLWAMLQLAMLILWADPFLPLATRKLPHGQTEKRKYPLQNWMPRLAGRLKGKMLRIPMPILRPDRLPPLSTPKLPHGGCERGYYITRSANRFLMTRVTCIIQNGCCLIYHSFVMCNNELVSTVNASSYVNFVCLLTTTNTYCLSALCVLQIREKSCRVYDWMEPVSTCSLVSNTHSKAQTDFAGFARETTEVRVISSWWTQHVPCADAIRNPGIVKVRIWILC
jgi:hypothetical protein